MPKKRGGHVLLIPVLDLPYKHELMRMLRDEGSLQVTASWTLPKRGIFFGKPLAVVHVHMLDMLYLRHQAPFRSLLRIVWFFAVVRPVLRLRGIRLVWTCHEWESHLLSGWRRSICALLSTAMARTSDRVIVHSRALGELVRARCAEVESSKIVWIPHGSLEQQYVYKEGCPVGVEDWLRGDIRLAMLGTIRENKKISVFQDAFHSVALPGITLLIAGAAVDPLYLAELREKVSADSRITMLEGGLNENKLIWLHRQASVIVFGPSIYPTSGAMETAIALGCKILASFSGYAKELAMQVPTGSIIFYGIKTGGLQDDLPLILKGLSAESAPSVTVSRHFHPFDQCLWRLYEQIYFGT